MFAFALFFFPFQVDTFSGIPCHQELLLPVAHGLYLTFPNGDFLGRKCTIA